LKHRKCVFCGLVNIINAEWYRTDRGFICRYCYDKKQTYATAREEMVKNHNEGMKNWLSRRYLKYYGDYLFGKTVKCD